MVAASFGPDLRGAKVGRLFEFLAQETCDVVVMEGPKDVAWDVAKQRGRAEGRAGVLDIGVGGAAGTKKVCGDPTSLSRPMP